MIESEKIITTVNEDKYIVIKTTNYNGINYFNAARIDADNSPTEDLIIFEEIMNDGKISILEVENKEILEDLELIFDQMIAEEYEKILDAELEELDTKLEELDEKIESLEN